MYPCNKCQVCPFVDQTNVFMDALEQKSYEIRDLINYSTTWVIYMFTCPCPKIYIGKTKRLLKVRIGEHLREFNEKDPDRETSGNHFSSCHGGNPEDMKVKGIYTLKLPSRRGTVYCSKKKNGGYTV